MAKDRLIYGINLSLDKLNRLVIKFLEGLLQAEPPIRIDGSILTLIFVIFLEFFSHTFFVIPDPFLILQFLVVYSVFAHGVGSGLRSAAVMWLYAVFSLSNPGELFKYSGDKFKHLIILTITTPLIVGMLGILKNRSRLLIIEEERLAQSSRLNEILRASERQYRLLFNRNPSPMFIYDPQTLQFLAVNDAAINHYGYDRSEFLAMTVDQIRPKEDLPNFYAYLEKKVKPLKKSEIVMAGIWKHQKKDGTVIEVETRWTPITFQDRRAILVLVNDITERRRVEKLKDEFISVASHELKTPLSTAKAYAQIIYKKLDSSRWAGETLTYLSRLIDQIDKLTSLVNDLLDVSKIEAGQLQLHKERFNLKTFLEEAIADLQKITETHKLLLKKAPSIQIEADKERIYQVLTNLINNAVKYSPNAKEVLIEASRQKDQVVVSVTDFGYGIPKESQEKIFERFYRIERGEEKRGGLGLGLYIAANIIYRHQGKIWVESEENKGSTFYFYLPLPQK